MSNHAINVSKCFRYFLGYRVVSRKSDTPDQPDEVDWPMYKTIEAVRSHLNVRIQEVLGVGINDPANFPQYKGFWKDFKKILKDKST